METKKSNKKSPKSLDDLAFEAIIAIRAYRRAMCFEFFKLDQLDSDYESMRTLYYELDDFYAGVMSYLNENANPFDNVL